MAEEYGGGRRIPGHKAPWYTGKHACGTNSSLPMKKAMHSTHSSPRTRGEGGVKEAL